MPPFGYHKRGFAGSPKKKPQITYKRGMYGGFQCFFLSERGERKKNLHIMRGSRAILDFIGLQKATFKTTIGTLPLFSVRMPKGGVTGNPFLLKVSRIARGAGDSQSRHHGSLKGFQFNIRFRDEFIAGLTRTPKAPWEGGHRPEPSTEHRQGRVK